MIKIMFEHLKVLRQIRRTFHQGQYLFHRDDRVKSMFLIETGSAQLIRHHDNGSAIVLQRAGPGAVLAEASLFSSQYHCEAIAVSQVGARVFSRASVQQLFFSNTEFAKAWVQHLGKEVRDARLHAEILTLKTVAARLDSWVADRSRFPKKGTWKSVAREIGVSPEALYREIAQRGSKLDGEQENGK